MPNTGPAIVVDKLCKYYGANKAVDNISFTVKSGEVFAFLGPNGAGKSTTAEVIETIRVPTSGTVTVLGMDVTKHKAKVVRRIGVLPQNFSSFDRITVRESLQYFARVFGCRADVDALMDLTDLRHKSGAPFNTLSGGLKQRLGIAIALVSDPEIVFLDEPTTGLDPHARHQIWDVLRGLKARGKTVFLTTHYMEEAELLADTVAIIASGRIVAMDSPAKLTEEHAEQTRLTLTSIDATAVGLIRSLGFSPIPKGNDSLSVPIKTPDDVRRILAEIERAGLALGGLDVRKPNLEEVFLKLTKTPAVSAQVRAA
ncbi:MAG: ABC transporter ATP-binding protein [Burkholderiales bacterium]|nr:ABC transporter ATP-binding protein [Burkholderiales bacterium]